MHLVEWVILSTFSALLISISGYIFLKKLCQAIQDSKHFNFDLVFPHCSIFHPLQCRPIACCVYYRKSFQSTSFLLFIFFFKQCSANPKIFLIKSCGGLSLWNRIFGLAWSSWAVQTTGDPPFMRFSLPRIPLQQFLAYVRASGDFCVSRGPLQPH